MGTRDPRRLAMGRARGTVDERQPGVWRLRADVPADPLTGQRRRVTKTVYVVKGKRQAQQELAKLLTELGVRPKRGGTRAKTVADACTAWLTVFDALVAAGKKSPASGLRFREVIESCIVPTVGEISLRDLTTEHINALYLQLLTEGKPLRVTEPKKHGKINPARPLAAATVQKTHVALSGALDHAISLDWLDMNPARKAVRPQPDTETGRSRRRAPKMSSGCWPKLKARTRNGTATSGWRPPSATGAARPPLYAGQR
jgi:hypothetical protein